MLFHTVAKTGLCKTYHSPQCPHIHSTTHSTGSRSLLAGQRRCFEFWCRCRKTAICGTRTNLDTIATAIDSPLVSILIRSMNRDYLARALDSIALQTYPHIEVEVIAARPGHRQLLSIVDLFRSDCTTTQPLLRSLAANKALDAARGNYCCCWTTTTGSCPSISDAWPAFWHCNLKHWLLTQEWP